ncbi:hypothetical protein Q7I24_17095 [Aeromonas veronii]|uniref:hypothetical protein n=1 Tax=Aeromonas veronii TaxID=654 RepID=UPI003004BD11
MMYRLLLLCLCLSFPSALLAATRFTLLSPENSQDMRMRYYREVMQLALEKTRSEYGDYELLDSLPMNKARMRIEVQEQGKSALFIVDSWPYQGEVVAGQGAEDQVASIPFPIDMGILGYRVCFVGSDRAAELARVNTLDQLRHFTQGVGTGWQDAAILRHGGLTVHEVDNYESLFRMVARGRIDLFCRGANEILSEWQSHQGKVAGLTVDRHLAIFYPLIHVFYSNARYVPERERLARGLQLAWQDGSLKRLWRHHFQPSLVFANLGARQIFRLGNPQLPKGGFDYRPYLYNPLADDFGSLP